MIRKKILHAGVCGESGLNDLCAGFKRFYRHALPEVERIVATLRKGRS